MFRYTVISFITGILDFLIALALLHIGLSTSLSLAISIVLAGVADYLALEKWGFSQRNGVFSSKRLIESGATEGLTYITRLVALWSWKTYFNDIEPTEHLIGLAMAYSCGFIVGYCIRRGIVFKA